MPRNQFERMVFAFITVVITVHAFVFYSVYVVNGDALRDGIERDAEFSHDAIAQSAPCAAEVAALVRAERLPCSTRTPLYMNWARTAAILPPTRIGHSPRAWRYCCGRWCRYCHTA